MERFSKGLEGEVELVGHQRCWCCGFCGTADEGKNPGNSDSRSVHPFMCSVGFSTSACQGQITLMVPSAIDVPTLCLHLKSRYTLPYLSNAPAPAGVCVKEVRGSLGASVREQKASISDVVTSICQKQK